MEPRKRSRAVKRPASFYPPSPHKIQTAHISLDPLFDSQADYLIRMIRIRQIRAIEMLLQPLGLPLSSWYPLAVLVEVDGLSQRELGGRLNLKDAAIGKAVDAMERSGLVVRMVGQDRRKALVYLTEQGKTVAKQVMTRRQQLLNTMLEGFSGREVQQFSRFLERAYRNIDNFVENTQDGEKAE